MIDIKQEIKKINNKGPILGTFEGSQNVGMTLEKALGKKPDRKSEPDFYGIEIKSKGKGNIYKYITLFNCGPIGKNQEILRIKEKYGYFNKKNKTAYKIFNIAVYCNKLVQIGGNRLATIKIDYQTNEIKLLILSPYLEILDDKCRWNLEELKKRLENKLNFLCYIKADKYVNNGEKYFSYDDVRLYKLKGFNEFLKLIEMGYIRINFKINYYKSGTLQGKTYDHGTGFEIYESALDLLFTKID